MTFFIVTLQPFIKYYLPPCFLSRNITKNAKSHLPPMRDVIIEEPLASYFVILGLWQHLTFTTGDLL